MENNKQNKNLSKSVKIMLVITVIATAILVLGLILILTIKTSSVGNFIIAVAGLIELIGSLALFGIFRHRQKFICPECGTKRTQHRKFLRTTQQQHTAIIHEKDGDSYQKRTVHYTHEYLDSFICPSCGETMEIHTKGDGGYVKYDGYGNIENDSRKAPKEF